MAKYLDQAGLAHFWGKINTKLSEINSGLGNKLEKGQISFALDENEENLVLTVGGENQSIPLSSLYDGVIDSVQLVDNKLQITTTSGGTFEVDLSSLNVNDTTSTVTVSNQIQVTGTPLADIFNASGVKSIDKGTDLQGLLEKLLCQEVWPEAITTTNPKVSVTFKDATSTNDKQIYEVGENVTTQFDFASTTPIISVNATNATLSNLTYGYALAPDGEIVKDTSYTVETTVNGFVEGTRDNIDISYEGGVDTSTAGNKTFIIKQTPRNKSFTYSNAGITSLYPANNLGNLGKNPEDHKQTIASVTDQAVTINDKPTTINYTVKYKYYIGTAATDPTTKDLLQSDTLKKLDGLSTTNAFLENSGTTTIVNEKTIVKTDGNSLYIAIPQSYTISSIKSSLGADVSGTLSATDITYVTDNDYKLYKLPVVGGAKVELKDIKITKK